MVPVTIIRYAGAFTIKVSRGDIILKVSRGDIVLKVSCEDIILKVSRGDIVLKVSREDIILEVTFCRKCLSVRSKNVKERRIPQHIVVAKSGYNIKPDIGRLYRGDGDGGGCFYNGDEQQRKLVIYCVEQVGRVLTITSFQ